MEHTNARDADVQPRNSGIIAREEAWRIITRQNPRELLRMAYRARWHGADGLAVLDLRTGDVRPDYWAHAVDPQGCEHLITLCAMDPDEREALGILPEDLLRGGELADLRRQQAAAARTQKVGDASVTFAEVVAYLKESGISYEERYEETVLDAAEWLYHRDPEGRSKAIDEQLDAAYGHRGLVG